MDTARHHLVRHVPVVAGDERVDAIIARLRTGAFDAVDAVYVVDADQNLIGAIRLAHLLAAPAERQAGEIADRSYPRVAAHHDQEAVAGEALSHGATSVAVVDGARLVGAVSARSLLEILRHEHVEDLHRLAGIQRESAQVRSALEEPPFRRARHRLPWLLVGLVGSMVAALVVSRFESVLEHHVAIAFFVPTIVYLADAIGTQTETVTVRGLSLSRRPLGHLLGQEIRTGAVIGLTMGVLAFPAATLVFGDVRLAAAVAMAIVVSGAVATSIGMLLPWLLQRSGRDPALGSGPVATILQDVLSLFIYFVIASLIAT